MSDTYRYQGQIVTLINNDEQSTEVDIRLPDGTEKTVSKDEITVEHESQGKVPEQPAESTKPAQS